MLCFDCSSSYSLSEVDQSRGGGGGGEGGTWEAGGASHQGGRSLREEICQN